MIKYVGVLKRKDGLTREEFLRHWEEVHGPLFLSNNVPGLSKYVQNHHAKVAGAEFESEVDGIAEIWFDDLEAAQAFLQWHRFADQAKDVREDAKSFINLRESPFFFGDAHVLQG